MLNKIIIISKSNRKYNYMKKIYIKINKEINMII